MTDIEMDLEVETEAFTEELSDESLDGCASRACSPGSCWVICQ